MKVYYLTSEYFPRYFFLPLKLALFNRNGFIYLSLQKIDFRYGTENTSGKKRKTF